MSVDARPAPVPDPDSVAEEGVPPDPAPGLPAPDEPRPPLVLASVRHPTERSRLVLALLVTLVSPAVYAVVIGFTLGVAVLALVIAVVFFFLGLLWLGLQLWRVHLLASAVRVSTETLPDVQRAVDEVRRMLGYTSKVSVYVLAKHPAGISLTSLFGTRVVLVEGTLIGDLAQDHRRHSELVHLLAQPFGALAARHSRSAPVAAVLELLGLTPFVNLFALPWLRATVYTGDRIAYACRTDLDASTAAVHRLLVGAVLAERIRRPGLVGQARSARGNPLLRLHQLLVSSPHPTNRYLELLAYARERELAGAAATSAASAELWRDPRVTEALPARRSKPSSAGLVAAAAVGLLAVVLAGVGGAVTAAAFGSPAATPEPTWGSEDTGTLEPDQSPAPTSPEPEPDVLALLALVPQSLRDSCDQLASGSDDPPGLVAAVACAPSAAAAPELVEYYQFEDQWDADQALDAWTPDVPEGTCADADAGESWNSEDGSRGGRLVCFSYEDRDIFLWTGDSEGLLVYAHSSRLDRALFYEWWQQA